MTYEIRPRERRAGTIAEARADRSVMPTHDELPGWELRGERPPHEAQFEAERERLRQLRVTEARERRQLVEKRRARTSVPPPPQR